MKKIPSIDDIVVYNTDDEWITKSGGTLSVLFRLDKSLLDKFLSYDNDELATIPQDIRGLRLYKVENISTGAVGANEWHRIRNELVFCLNGRLRWTCRDTYGNTQEFTLDKNTAVLTPHHILHQYEALQDNSCISVLANTLFDTSNPLTHDTYPAETLPHHQ